MENHKKAFTIGILLVILLSFPILLFTLRNRQDTRQRASEDTSLLAASYGNQVVTKVDLEAYIKKVNPASASVILKNAQAKKYYLDLYLEEKFVQSEAKKQNISVTTDTLDEEKNSLFLDKTIADVKKYALLHNPTGLSQKLLTEEVSDKVETWKEVDMVSVYVSPETDHYQASKTQMQSIMNEMKGLVSATVTLPQAFARIQAKYPTQTSEMRLQERLRINKGSDIDPQLKTPLFLVQKGTLSSVITSTGGAMILVSVLDENNTNYASYKDWLTQQKKGVTYYQ